MTIKFMSPQHAVKEVRRLSTTYGKAIGMRTRIVLETGEGIDTVNENQDIKMNINIVPFSNRVLIPTDFAAFKKQLKQTVKKVNWSNVDMVSVGNEWLVWIEPDTDTMKELDWIKNIVHTTKIVYDVFTDMGIKVANSGTPTPLLSGGTYTYLQQTKGQAASDDFYARWVSPSLQFSPDLAPRALKEWDMYMQLGMDKLVNTFHFALRESNIDCVKDIVSYLRSYSSGHEVRNNETTVWDMKPTLLNRYLTILKGGGIDYAVGYSDNVEGDNMSNPFTPDVEKVLCSFAN